jgi:hypothetical protein
VSIEPTSIEEVKPKSEDEQFYEFFEKFNGFPINDDQKFIHKSFKSGKNGESSLLKKILKLHLN